MAVDKVNSIKSSDSYIIPAAIGGGLVTGTIGWFTRPYIKNGQPTDKFVRELEKEAGKYLPMDTYEAMHKASKAIENAQSVDEVVEITTKPVIDLYKTFTIENAKKGLQNAIDISSAIGRVTITPEEVEAVESMDDVIKLIIKDAKNALEGKSLQEIKDNAKLQSITNIKKELVSMFNYVWDGNRKKFRSLEELGLQGAEGGVANFNKMVYKVVMNTVNKFRDKTAAIWGLAGALIAGVVTKIVIDSKDSKASKEI